MAEDSYTVQLELPWMLRTNVFMSQTKTITGFVFLRCKGTTLAISDERDTIMVNSIIRGALQFLLMAISWLFLTQEIIAFNFLMAMETLFESTVSLKTIRSNIRLNSTILVAYASAWTVIIIDKCFSVPAHSFTSCICTGYDFFELSM